MNIFMQWAHYYGGTCVDEFEQGTYLLNFPEWLRGGCCMTLCCNWIAKDGDMAAFKNHIYSPVGMAQVRGFQGLATRASGPASQLGGYFVGFVSEALKIYKCDFRGEMAIGEARSGRSISEICRFVQAREAYYQYHFKQRNGSSGHAIAFRRRGPTLAIFDPNYGMVAFNGPLGGASFECSLTKLLRDFYPDLDGHWELMRVYRR